MPETSQNQPPDPKVLPDSKAAPRAALSRRPPPSLANKLARAVWCLAELMLFRFTPTPLHAWRRQVLRTFGARVGRRAAIYPGAHIWAPWNLSIGQGATIGDGAIVYNVTYIEIGEFAVVSQGAHLCAASHDHQSPSFDLVVAPIRIETEAWVAAEAFVGPGVTVGMGAVLGARAVVFRSIGERRIAVGNPARIVGRRDLGANNRLVGRSGSQPAN